MIKKYGELIIKEVSDDPGIVIKNFVFEAPYSYPIHGAALESLEWAKKRIEETIEIYKKHSFLSLKGKD